MRLVTGALGRRFQISTVLELTGETFRTNFLTGGGGVGVIGTQTHLPAKFSFSSDLGHFVLKIWKMTKLYTF